MPDLAQSIKNIPFALLDHESSYVDDDKVLGNIELEWNWKPAGDWTSDKLKIYASGGTSTTRETGYNQWDHGEFY